MRLEEVYKILDSIEPNEDGCCIWPGGKDGKDYGVVKIMGFRQKAHRLALERKLGRFIQIGFFALHTCDCNSCVSPDHLIEADDIRRPKRNTLESVYKLLDAILPDERGCRQWPGAKISSGYGEIRINGLMHLAHRIVLKRKLERPLYPGFRALHTCDCKSCCNPEHIYEGTEKDNCRDRRERNPNTLAGEAAFAAWARRPENRERAREHARDLAKIRWWKRSIYHGDER
jgi:hypothetical protein